jgi:cell division transport system permease protein
MSGSYDRPTGPPLPPPSTPHGRGREEHYSHPLTGSPDASGNGRGRSAEIPGNYGADGWSQVPDGTSFDRELSADERSGGAGSQAAGRVGGGTVVPAGSVTSRSLTLVVAIMCFLACLTAGGVYMVNQSASAWLRDIASEVTLQIEPREKIDIETSIREAATFLSKQPGVRGVRPLTHEESAALVEPWLGKSDVLKALPIPRLIAVEVDRLAPPDIEALRERVTAEIPGSTLDDHRHWQQQIRTVTRSLALGGLAILMLVGAATTAIIVSATRSSMLSNNEIVEVLHLVGATDRYIAREFERHFLRLGIRAGLVGAISAMLVFMLMPIGMEMLGGNVVTMAEMRRLFGAGVLDLPGYAVLIVVVIVIAALCMLTSRFGVYRILDKQQ